MSWVAILTNLIILALEKKLLIRVLAPIKHQLREEQLLMKRAYGRKL